MKSYLTLVIFGIFAAVRIACHFMDKSRIRALVEDAGGKVLSISWAPFAKGWLGETVERHYKVSYRTPDGLVTNTTCKTSLFTGVYWSGDTLPHLPGDKLRTISPTLCTKCGCALKSTWKVCPSCGKIQ